MTGAPVPNAQTGPASAPRAEKTAPAAAPNAETTPQTAPKTALQTAPETTPQTAPKTALQTGPETTPATDTTLRLGLDVGSTTVKAVVTRGTEIIFSAYRRHNADVRREMLRLLTDVAEAFPEESMYAAITGSGGLSVSQGMGVGFVQEVVASTEAIERLNPDVDVMIELGGEDAKLTYLKPTPEQRMNGTCAGGTGAFIDQMASLLNTDAAGLNTLAEKYETIYPIASRCGVFAKTDVQPLINQGARHEDIAASVFEAVAIQTVGGLAAGRPIRGNVIFLGGPLHFLPQMREAFRRVLGEQVENFVTPENGQLYVALGAAMLASGPAQPVSAYIEALEHAQSLGSAAPTLRPLFENEAEKREFDERHARATVPQADIKQARGPLWLGIDAGSTTIKTALIDAEGQIVHSTYGSNEGEPVQAAVELARTIMGAIPEGAYLARAAVTGYGEDLVKAALHVDEGVIETMAHYRAAAHLSPNVTSVIDIGGQDMKYIKIRNGAVDSISVNEACSAGCGSFLQTFAATMGTDIIEFAKSGLQAKAPVDLGSRCTVFMNSAVKAAQKEGANAADICAGLSYSVVRNALYKVIKMRSPEELGEHVVAQGGTFLNDAVLRAFELLTGREVIRPNIAGLMGAYGAALTAQRNWEEGSTSSMLRRDLDGFAFDTEQRECKICQNRCKLTITTFDDGTRQVSGNRCDRGASLEKRPKKSEIPNLYDYKYERIFGYRRPRGLPAPRGPIGIPRALGIYENYPLWWTILTELGFRVRISGRSSHGLFQTGMESIASENVCYPAKLAHGHIEWLLSKKVKTIFMPCVNYEYQQFEDADNTFNCPIVAFYPQVLDQNIEGLDDPEVRFLYPFVTLNDPQKLAEQLANCFAYAGVTVEEARKAVDSGFAEMENVRRDIKAEGDRALQYMREHDMRGIVLAGRPYHIDPEINHGIPELIQRLGMVVLSEDALTGDMTESTITDELYVRDQWTYHKRLYEAAAIVRRTPDLSLVQLNSFGCGIDAVTTDQVQEILEKTGDIYTSLKIDENSNLGAARIRLRSLQSATIERAEQAAAEQAAAEQAAAEQAAAEQAAAEQAAAAASFGKLTAPNGEAMRSVDIDTTQSEEEAGYSITPAGAPVFGEEEARTHRIYVPQMSPVHFRMIEPILSRAGYDVEVLEHASREDVELGLRYVNNDACYPAIMVIGQLVNKFVTGGADPDRSSVAITQTGGMCRATNYVGMLRKALRDAGYPQVPVIALSAQGIETNPGFKLTPQLLHRAVQAVVIGDLLQTVLLRVRPYEAEEGAAMRLYERWDAITREFFRSGYSETAGRRVGYTWIIKNIVREFDELPLRDEPRRPRVGLVGEILVKFHPDANNDAVRVIESEGCEAVLPGLAAFFLQGMYVADYKWEHFGLGTKAGRSAQKLGIKAVEVYEKPMRDALAATNGKFDVPAKIDHIAAQAQKIISLGTQAGEGWLLVGEMIELIESGAPNIICAQPFACLPNHVVGRGMFRALRHAYPQSNVVSIDYDPGASETNQLNRIKLMVSTAHKAWAQAMESGEPIQRADGKLIDPHTGVLADWSGEDEFAAQRGFGAFSRARARAGSRAGTQTGRRASGASSRPGKRRSARVEMQRGADGRMRAVLVPAEKQ
ncbi:acyl-CoA dehydratase activase-related protein [Actinobaculum suis]|uniref:acyl-CoA dehydratase activase-related protein n=1 Tax=Actinobaculum suis TaxID=1657 RepID=UPI0009E35C2D|nr:acyl-CoA dehydratase activase-related protein [Actinobaculum suis]